MGGRWDFLFARTNTHTHTHTHTPTHARTHTAPNIYTENEQVAKYEIMDGAPVRGESIPIRLFLAGYDLSPTMRDINKKFSVRYYLNLVLVDEEERRYFKQQVTHTHTHTHTLYVTKSVCWLQEIVLWRKADPRATRKAATTKK